MAAFTIKLEHPDGTRADPPILKAAVPDWQAGHTIHLGRDRTLRVIATRLEEGSDGDLRNRARGRAGLGVLLALLGRRRAAIFFGRPLGRFRHPGTVAAVVTHWLVRAVTSGLPVGCSRAGYSGLRGSRES
jgi:hypothetical protein